MQLLTATCPHCRRYTPGFWGRVTLSSRFPRICPKCEGLFVNHLAAEMVGMLAFAASVVAVLFASPVKISLLGVIVISVVLFQMRAFFIRTIPYVPTGWSGRPLDTDADGSFVSSSDFPALIAALKASGKNGSFWVVLIPNTGKAGGSPANLQFSIEGGELGMDWVLIAQRNRDLKDRFRALASLEGLNLREVKRRGVKYIRATGDKDWPDIAKRILEQMFKEDQLTKMQLIVTGFEWTPT